MAKGIHIRELMKFTPDELLSGLRVNYKVLFDDGNIIELSFRDIIVNRYLFQVLELVPELPIISKFSFTNYLVNNIYATKTFNKAYEVMLENIILNYVKPIDNRNFLELIYERMYEVFNEIYNKVIYSNLNYATSLDIEDFLEIQFDEELIASMQRVYVDKDSESVNNSHNTLDRLIYTKESLKHNKIAKGYIAGTFNPNQIKQMLASRGYVTEIDSSIFKYPISSSFVLGMTDLYDITIESRSGAKALFLSNKAVQDSEYSARELQLVTMMVEKLVDGDCGNKEYLNWYVRTTADVGKSDLENMIGKRYLNEETGKEEVITKDHKHLEGKTIKLRTSINCKLEDKRCICTACFGDLAYGVFDNSNIGHLSSTTMTQKITQSILSTKHITTSATSNDVYLDINGQLFFVVKNKIGYCFKPNLLNRKNVNYKLIINQNEAGIKDLNPNVDVYKLNPQRVSNIESMIIQVTENGKEELFPIIVKDMNKRGAFTYEFLNYIANTGFYLDDLERYVIDLSGWNSTNNMLILPQVEFNFLALSKAVKGKFKYMSVLKGVKSKETREAFLQSIFDLVNTKLDVNIALLEVVVYAFTIMSIRDKNYDLGRNSDDAQLMRIDGILNNRSLGGSYAHERVLNTILSPRSFTTRNAFDHPLDVLVDPNATILDYYGTLMN